MAFFLVGDVHRFHRIRNIEFGDRADLDTVHMRNAGDDVGAHLARADKADPDRLSGFAALPEIAGQTGR